MPRVSRAAREIQETLRVLEARRALEARSARRTVTKSATTTEPAAVSGGALRQRKHRALEKAGKGFLSIFCEDLIALEAMLADIGLLAGAEDRKALADGLGVLVARLIADHFAKRQSL
jgi:hypothetical protein